ncbi:hypothetical protein CFE70_008440 [Pyrenophora teres f. teres 0-1]|uniref:APC-CDC26 domain containing protein n=1 Tax=Pyrenophora teres f. teres TaxID=97479 RepID=A0A6S6WC47_9PLEO|nr:APC-CDC26 domain containing protein [Pyrenophora teres f. teres]
MLRRAPTTITLTQTDIEQWEQDRKRKVHEVQQKLEDEQRNAQSANDAKAKQKSKKDRIMEHLDNALV